ncbi:SAM-dependent methyltransferase [Nocardia sp. NPDC051321]|uniref:SAM-dependent methyltransferase n=1 Tax=Nocardia sp. NPDC051321 TaxID=3364323 RepID=UPI0037AEACD7
MKSVDNFDQSSPHPARMYDWYLGGKDYYPVDQEAATKVLEVFPSVRRAAWVNREFMHRATTYLATIGIRQFLDIGTGIPTEWNLHQIAQKVAPESRIVYVDNDPLVLTHARALLGSTTTAGRTAYAEADVRHTHDILNAPELIDTLDLTRPVAISLVALLHFVPAADHPYDIVSTLMDAVPSGSYLVISHATADFDPEAFEHITRIYQEGGIDAEFRCRADVERFFAGLDLVEPGVTPPHRWRQDVEVPLPRKHSDYTSAVSADALDALVSFYAGVAVKP